VPLSPSTKHPQHHKTPTPPHTGMILAFYLGRYLLHDALSSLLLKRVKNFQEIDRRVAQEGWKLVLLLRLSPLMPYNVSGAGSRARLFGRVWLAVLG